jgi:hypothetical protein
MPHGAGDAALPVRALDPGANRLVRRQITLMGGMRKKMEN